MMTSALRDDDDTEEYGPKLISSTNCAWIPKLFEESYRTTQLVFRRREGVTITSLRQPRDLYTLSATSAQVLPKWPSEIQVVIERPSHILYTPPRREPLQKPNENAFSNAPKCSMGIFGKVIYDNAADPMHKYFVSSKSNLLLREEKSESVGSHVTNQENISSLLFESRFESGNLMRAVKVGEHAYELWLRFDMYTKKHTQWFYFQVKNAKPNVVYKFSIMNFIKSGSLYNEGMKPLIYSVKDAHENNVGWVRTGENIRYYKNGIRVEEEGKERSYYSLEWTMQFSNADDVYYLAHSYPYTYSDLQEYLKYLAFDPRRKKVCTQRILCQTLAGNSVHVLTITSPTRCPKQAKMKKVIVISARVHPGETVASWMMKGFLDFITSEEKDAKILRETFIFKVVPMLNPDGVIVGNYRCSLAGRDLNRNYKSTLKDSFPPVCYMKAMIKKLHEERNVVLYCDFHGHSRKKNVFIYGCENTNDTLKGLHTRVFPLMLAKNAPDKFSYESCRFHVQKSKEGTGRVVMWNMGIKYSYTLEASFCGSSLANGGNYHFGVEDYEAIGYHFCDTLLDFFDPDTSKFNIALGELEVRLQTAIVHRMNDKAIDPTSFSTSILSDLETDTNGSDSSVSDGLPMQLLYGSPKEVKKKKRMRTRKERNRRRKKLQKHVQKKEQEAIVRPSGRALNDKSTSSTINAKISYNSKKVKDDKSFCCLTPSKISTPSTSSSTADYLDSITYSYVQTSVSEMRENRPLPCEKCNASYYLSQEGSNENISPTSLKSRSPVYSLFEIRMPSHRIAEAGSNPTLELARKITAYNYRTGKLPPRMSRMFSIWSRDNQKKEANIQKQKKGDKDTDYSKERLNPLSSDQLSSYEPKKPFDLSATRRNQLVTHTATSVDISACQNTRHLDICENFDSETSSNNVVARSSVKSDKRRVAGEDDRLQKSINCWNEPPLLPLLGTHKTKTYSCDTARQTMKKWPVLPSSSFNIGLEQSIRKVWPLRDLSPGVAESSRPSSCRQRRNNRRQLEGVKVSPRLSTSTSIASCREKISLSVMAPSPRLSKSENFSTAIYPVEKDSERDVIMDDNEGLQTLRVLTPQQYCIFSELDNDDDEPVKESVVT